MDVRLAALDTGSSSDNKVDSERLASRENRRLAAQSLLQRWAQAGAGCGHRCGDPSASQSLQLSFTQAVSPPGTEWPH